MIHDAMARTAADRPYAADGARAVHRPHMLVDTHAHLQDPRFAEDLPETLDRASAAGVGRIVVIGYDLPSSRAAVELAETDERLWATVGIHPHDAQTALGSTLEAIGELARHPRVVAVGETGLDFYRDLSPREAQARLMRWSLACAREVGKPAVVHVRDAFDEALALLDEPDSRGAVIMHCFSGGPEVARECVARGYFLGIGGPVTYPRSAALRKAVAQVPDSQLLLETDCPYLPPQRYRGRRNEPAYLELVAREVARVRGVTLQELAARTTATAGTLFGLPAVATV